MARLAKGRRTYLTAQEIVDAALGLFDAGAGDMSFRNLAAALNVTPAAIYHYFPSRYELVMAVVSRVWDEAALDFASKLGDPTTYEGDPEEFLIAGAVAVRRAFERHWRVAPYSVAPADPNRRIAGGIALFAAALEGLGFEGERAAVATYAFSHYALGAVVVSASRRLAAEELSLSLDKGPGATPTAFSSVELRPEDAPPSSPETAAAIDRVLGTVLDPAERQAHEDLFVEGLRALLRGLRTD